MKIYTKTGDTGETSLVGGRRVSKASERVCAYGDLDELISYIALLRCHIETEDAVLRQIQAALMTASAHVASDVENPRLTPFPEDGSLTLEKEIDRMSGEMPPMKSFVLPSRPVSAAHCHVARCICRRSERSCVALGDERPVMVAVLRYLRKIFGLTRGFLYIFADQNKNALRLCIGHLNWPRSSKTLPGPQPKTN